MENLAAGQSIQFGGACQLELESTTCAGLIGSAAELATKPLIACRFARFSGAQAAISGGKAKPDRLIRARTTGIAEVIYVCFRFQVESFELAPGWDCDTGLQGGKWFVSGEE